MQKNQLTHTRDAAWLEVSCSINNPFPTWTRQTGGALASSNHVTQKTGQIGYFQRNHGGWPEELWCSRPASPVRMKQLHTWHERPTAATVPSAVVPVPLSPGDDHFQPWSPFLRRHLSVERARARWRPPDINSSFLDFSVMATFCSCCWDGNLCRVCL